MKIRHLLHLVLLSIGSSTTSLAQRSLSRLVNYDAVTTFRVGQQNARLTELNQFMQQSGYLALRTKLPMFSVASQFSRPNRPLALIAEAGMSVGSGSNSLDGRYLASASLYYAKLGASYRVIRTDKLEIGPQLSLAALPFSLRVSPVSEGDPSLTTVLTDPGSARTATFQTSAFGVDAGLSANWWVSYNRQQVDCVTVERSLVVALDAGYRLAARAPFYSLNKISAVQLSGWYAGLHLGFGTRMRTTGNSGTH